MSTRVTTPETRPVDDVAALYKASSRKLLGLVLAVGDNPADAEDIVHEAYARLLMSWHRVSRCAADSTMVASPEACTSCDSAPNTCSAV